MARCAGDPLAALCRWMHSFAPGTAWHDGSFPRLVLLNSGSSIVHELCCQVHNALRAPDVSCESLCPVRQQIGILLSLRWVSVVVVSAVVVAGNACAAAGVGGCFVVLKVRGGGRAPSAHIGAGCG